MARVFLKVCKKYRGTSRYSNVTNANIGVCTLKKQEFESLNFRFLVKAVATNPDVIGSILALRAGSPGSTPGEFVSNFPQESSQSERVSDEGSKGA